MYSKAECIEALQEANGLVDGVLTAPQYRSVDVSPTVRTIVNKFGSWNEAKNEAGLVTVDFDETHAYRLGHGMYGRKRSIGEEYEFVYDHGHKVQVHRLVAVAEYGFDAVADKVVHHESKHGLDNRPSNIGLMDRSDHSRMHANEYGLGHGDTSSSASGEQ